MKQTLKEFAIGAITGGAFALLACTVTSARPVTNPNELMVVVPKLEFLGYSRISTVEHCARLTGVRGDGWMELTTDSELEGMEACLVENT